jgi:hypothetical protein
MSHLLWACVLYLAGVAAVLYFRPDLMFYPDGEWREFGFDREQKTPFPFWLFCIVWALVSYTVMYFAIGGHKPTPILPIQSTATIDSVKADTQFVVSEPNRPRRGRRALPPDLRPGYYMLNSEAAEIDGVPRYIFIGAEAPEMSRVGSENAS